MPNNDIKEFYNKLAENEELRKKVSAIEDDIKTEVDSITKETIIKEIIPLAKQHGFNFSYDEFIAWEDKLLGENSDLESICAGGITACVAIGAGSKCGCLYAGYGKGGCICPMFGGGSK